MILVLGESGTGKSTSLRNLDHKETAIINIIDKPLPFRGYRGMYNKENKNYCATDDFNAILKMIDKIDKERTDIKNIVIDDFQFIMCNEFMRRAKEKGYDKYSEMAQHVWLILVKLKDCRDDLNCIVINHSELDVKGKAKVKTIGNMVDKHIGIESMFTCVLHAMKLDKRYVFLTQEDPGHVAKSPIGMFDSDCVDNDLNVIIKEINKYNNWDGDVCDVDVMITDKNTKI
jgi:hypothetical protein